eukprot:6212865-Pleurochrysis_carterae.AAC.1
MQDHAANYNTIYSLARSDAHTSAQNSANASSSNSEACEVAKPLPLRRARGCSTTMRMRHSLRPLQGRMATREIASVEPMGKLGTDICSLIDTWPLYIDPIVTQSISEPGARALHPDILAQTRTA